MYLNVRKTRIIIFIVGLFVILLVTGCGRIIHSVAGVPDINVYNETELQSNRNELPDLQNVVDAVHEDIPDSKRIQDFAFLALASSNFVYDQNNNLLCYNGNSKCTRAVLTDIVSKSLKDSFDLCDEELLAATGTQKLSLKEIMSFIEILEQNDIDINSYKYKIFTFWNTDISKGEIKDEWDAFYNSFNNKNEILVIRIWTDLDESWGLEPDGKARLVVRKAKGKKEYTMKFKSLPYKD